MLIKINGIYYFLYGYIQKIKFEPDKYKYQFFIKIRELRDNDESHIFMGYIFFFHSQLFHINIKLLYNIIKNIIDLSQEKLL